MNRAQLRRTLRGWLQDQATTDSERQWPDADTVISGQQRIGLNNYINLGLKETQKILVGVDPELLKCQYRRNLTVPSTGRDKLIPWPAGTWAVFEVRLSTDGGTNYGDPLERITLAQARNATLRTDGQSRFVPYDANYFMLVPSPSTAQTWGISVTVMPTAVFALDTDELPVRFVAHETMILKQAQKLALADVGEPTDKIEAEIAALENRVPRFYLTATSPSFVVPTGYDSADYELS